MSKPIVLANASDRLLRMIATLVYGQPVEILRSERLKHPAVVVAKARKIFLNPELCGMYDRAQSNNFGKCLNYVGNLAGRN